MQHIAQLVEQAVRQEAGEEIERLRARVAELEAAARWIPVEERLPEEKRWVWVSGELDLKTGGRPFRWVQDAFLRNGEWIEEGFNEEQDLVEENGRRVVAWMPEPQPYGGPA